MSGLGQTWKNSVRAYVFRFALKLGRCSIPLALLKRANRARLRHVARASKFRSKKNPPRRYRVFFAVRADLAWVARSISGGGCWSPAIAHQTLTEAACNDLSSTLSLKFG